MKPLQALCRYAELYKTYNKQWFETYYSGDASRVSPFADMDYCWDLSVLQRLVTFDVLQELYTRDGNPVIANEIKRGTADYERALIEKIQERKVHTN